MRASSMRRRRRRARRRGVLRALARFALVAVAGLIAAAASLFVLSLVLALLS